MKTVKLQREDSQTLQTLKQCLRELRLTATELETLHLEVTLEQVNHNRTHAAKSMDLCTRTILNKIRKHKDAKA